jgi:hypothetical protein
MLKEIKIADIKIGKRHRKDMGDLNVLADSIRRLGLLQPIGVTEDFKLVFGERRLRAQRDILKRSKGRESPLTSSMLIASSRANMPKTRSVKTSLPPNE